MRRHSSTPSRPIAVFLCMLLGLSMLDAVSHPSQAVELQYYLPQGVAYDNRVPVPSATLGYEVGDWHVRHDQLVEYMRTLAAASDRVTMEETGRTYEQRPLLLLTITSPENHRRLEAIRQAHRNLTQPGADAGALEDLPVVVYLGYSVHGNESSGANASMVVAYHLAAAQGAAMDSLLENTIILLDPSLNPDGLSRFSHWANTHRGKNAVGDPSNREHVEKWPSGRTNHYLFDLNRDWLLLQHPESRSRVAQFQKWKPNVLTDFHEMGSNSTYFFQPGVSSRKNPLTPQRNVELTQLLAKHHAEAFDGAGVLYYSEEDFDDFYYGKGSTYPDINGCIGILFEQASARGHRQESINGEFDFSFTIRNQCLTSYSTLAGALQNRIALLQWQRDFYDSGSAAGVADGVAGYVFGGSQQRHTSRQLLSVLLQHDIQVHMLASNQNLNGVSFASTDAWVVPTNQPQGRLVRTLFDTQTTFEDSLFYDVSTWTMPLAMGVPFAAATRLPSGWLGARVTQVAPSSGTFESGTDVYAYAFEWHEYLAPRALGRLHAAEVRVRVATRPFSAPTQDGVVQFARGTIVVPVALQDISADAVRQLLQSIAQEEGVDVHALSSGFTPQGVDLGSPSLRPLQAVHPAIVVGEGVSSSEVGEAWHLLDQRMDLTVTLLDIDEVGATDLSKYTHLILVNGSYGALSDATVEEMKRWVRNGGVLMAQKSAVRWVRDKEFADVAFADDNKDDKNDKNDKNAEKKAKKGEQKQQKSSDKETSEAETKAKSAERHNYADHERTENAHIISGAIFGVDVDVTHPLGFGFPERHLAVFRNSRRFMKADENPYTTVALYEEKPLLSGWISSRNLKELPGTASVIAQRLGSGAVILFVDNPNFRGFWYGTSKLFLNAVFFGEIIDRTNPID